MGESGTTHRPTNCSPFPGYAIEYEFAHPHTVVIMRDMTFRRPPLIEVVAELRWDVPALQGVPEQFAGALMPVADGSPHEMHFMNFASKAGGKGFGLVERVIPPGFPLLAGQVAFRYRNPTSVEGAPLFQLGPGVFTVNLVPPYKSWSSFLPYIELGLDLLLDSRSPEHQQQEFSEARLRYIDAFGDDLRQGSSIINFLAQSLGVTIGLPESVTQFCTDRDRAKLNLTVSLPIEQGSMEIKIADGWVRNTHSLIMDTTVSRTGPLAPEKNAILSVMNDAHRIIHDSFVGMTGPLHQLMEPVAGA